MTLTVERPRTARQGRTPSLTQWSVLVADQFDDAGVKVLERAAKVERREGLSENELVSIIGNYDALIVRSETKVTGRVIEAARRLKVVGRAGVGVNNIDISAATAHGVIVVNAPTGNTVSAAELTIALMLTAARNIPAADRYHKEKESKGWERGQFKGFELRDKTLGIMGLGNVGTEVAKRATAFEMRVITFDPFVANEHAGALGVEVIKDLHEFLRQSDFLTIHVPRNEETKGMIGRGQFEIMKRTAILVNTGHGETVNEDELIDALKDGLIAGAGLDVYTVEPTPPAYRKRAQSVSSRITITPHLGASTVEAQERVSIDVAQQILAVLRGEPAQYAVNAPLIPPEDVSRLAPYVSVAQKVGMLVSQLHSGKITQIEIELSTQEEIGDMTPLKAAALAGLLAPVSEEHVNIINVDIVARRKKLRISIKAAPADEVYADLLRIRLRSTDGVTTVAGTIAHDGPHIVSIDDFWVDVPPSEGYLLLVENRDRPGMVGGVGTLMGEFGVNISYMNVGRHEKSGNALMVLALDDTITPEQIARVREIQGIVGVRLARL